ncbi:phage tail protein [Rahnella woolbedingensis]|uniref:Phage tail protein n=1 Tax=Rahnella woolbedingensis TaxID=1510574 RepID=A0A419N4V9_9GAMM|nr:phage tail protein [Rahnella woolbedingensis]RJT40513.1 phage tail protein [Rahnella woolbedingensis]
MQKPLQLQQRLIEQVPLQLQQRLIEQVPLLAASPDKLAIATGAGQVVATSAASLSFEYRYPLKLTVSDAAVPGEALIDQIVVVILDWLQVNQPEILGNAASRLTDFTFTQQEKTLVLTLQLTERVQVCDEDDVRTIIHLPEPPLPENVSLPREVYLNGELISSWTV